MTCRRAWLGRVALLRDRRCSSGNFPLLITRPQPLSYVHVLLVHVYERATPVARERNPTEPHAGTTGGAPEMIPDFWVSERLD
jgi:hypothetical protein